MSAQEYIVEVQSDFIERETRAQPVQALAELIWNAVDADATRVDVDFVDDALGGVKQIVVSDDGHGMPYHEAPELFRRLGGSWKKHGSVTKLRGRMLHGREGRGRFRAFALGGAVDWKVVCAGATGNSKYTVSILESDIQKLRRSDEEPFAGPTGVTVVIDDLKRQFPSLAPERSVQEFAEIFAIYLKNYSDVSIRISGEVVDPTVAIADNWQFDLPAVTDESGNGHSVSLEIIEWRRPNKRALYLCNQQGFPLSQVETRFHVGDFHFSAYLKSSFIDELHQENRLDLAEMTAALSDAIANARNKIREVFRERASQRAKAAVDEWKENKIYPYEGEPTTPLERAERQIFEIVAVTAQDAMPEARETPRSQMALQLRLIRNALERSPDDLQKIFGEVLKLPARKQRELATLLDEVDLSGIINAAALVADRLKFLHGLRIILFEFEAKSKLKERSQLHKIIEQNTWLFGEEYNLWASDKDLTTVLKVHKVKLDESLVIDDPVKVINRTRGVVDLMLSRAQRRHRSNDFEHLVIELKAPRVKLTAEHVTQIEDYALAVEEDPRFNRVTGLSSHESPHFSMAPGCGAGVEYP